MRVSEVVQAWGRILSGRTPSISIEITRECPLRCPGCYAYEDGHLGVPGLTLRQLADFRPVLTAERAVNENIDKLEPKLQTLLIKALGELREGVDAARRAIVERCHMRAFAP